MRKEIDFDTRTRRDSDYNIFCRSRAARRMFQSVIRMLHGDKTGVMPAAFWHSNLPGSPAAIC
jgi:hypothetical protein